MSGSPIIMEDGWAISVVSTGIIDPRLALSRLLLRKILADGWPAFDKEERRSIFSEAPEIAMASHEATHQAVLELLEAPGLRKLVALARE
jgi:hypothetical protein